MLTWGQGGRKLRRLAAIGLVGYLLMLGALVVNETALVYPRPPVSQSLWKPPGLDYETVRFEAADGTRLRGWFFAHPQPRAHLLFCHGNASQVPDLAPELDALRERLQVSIFVFDYRGYGRSEGTPSEPGVIDDGSAAQAWLARRAGILPEEVVLFGRSLGGGVAVALAAQHGARALILDRTFDSLVDVAAAHYPWVPTRLLMRNRFPSAERIAGYQGPLLQLHGRRDQVVPFAAGRRLFAASRSADKEFLSAPRLDHFGPLPADFIGAIDRLLTRLCRLGQVRPVSKETLAARRRVRRWKADSQRTGSDRQAILRFSNRFVSEKGPKRCVFS
jgi:fermentation-respiration switch protein FrsA (DUF1100 family)